MAPVPFGNVATAAFGFARSLWLGLVFLAAAGAASSANCAEGFRLSRVIPMNDAPQSVIGAVPTRTRQYRRPKVCPRLEPGAGSCAESSGIVHRPSCAAHLK